MSSAGGRRPALRNGVDDGQEPTQIPQLAHRSALTCAICRPRRPLAWGTIVIAANGQSSKQRRQPLQLAGSTCATGAAAGCGRKGSPSSNSSAALSSSQTTPADVASVSGWMKSRNQSSASAPGASATSAGAWLITGATSASASSAAKVPQASARGGNTAARLRRWMWNHRPNSSSSGTPRWMNMNSENSRSATAPAVRKLRAIGDPKTGSQSSHSAVAMAENWPSWSQLSQKPPTPLAKANSSSGTPVSQEKRRKPW